jgi:ABC-type nitrate/sulfonate/bicarbonate transport system permease component
VTVPGWARGVARTALYSAGSVVLALGMWQFLAASGVLHDGALPPLPDMVDAAGAVLGSGALWQPAWDTLSSSAAGLLLAIAIAVPLGVGIGTFLLLREATKVIVEFLRPIPPPAILPVAVLVLGAGFESKTLLVTFGCVFPILVQTVDGVRSIDPMSIQTARAFRIGRGRQFASLTVPAVLPWVFTGVRVAASIALLVAVSVEVIVGAPGLGRAITNASSSNEPATMTVYVIACGILGIAISAGLTYLQRRLITWDERGQGQVAP